MTAPTTFVAIDVWRSDVNINGQTGRIRFRLPSGREMDVYAEGPRVRFGGEITEPTINWSALGSCNLDDSRAFAAALVHAADFAETLSGPVS